MAPPGLGRRIKAAASRLVTSAFGSSCRHRALNRQGLREELGTCEVLRPSQGGDGSFLRAAAVTPAVRDGYRRVIAAFLVFCLCLSLPLQSCAQIDQAMCKWADEQFAEEVGPAVGERLLSAFCSEFPEHQPGDFPLFLRALRGWRRLKPKTSRHPLPWPMLCAAAFFVLTRTEGDFEGMMALLLMFDCYLRPYELLRLRVKDLVAPAGDHHWWCVVTCPREAMKPSKTNTFDDSVLLDSVWRPQVAALIPILLRRCRDRGLANDDLVFSFGHLQLSRWLAAAMSWLGLSSWNFTLYSARHGGPSEDFLKHHRPMEVIQRRGRWAAEASTRRYQQHGRLQIVYSQSPAAVLRHCLQVEAHLLQLVLRRLRGEPCLLSQPPRTAFEAPAAAPLPEED